MVKNTYRWINGLGTPFVLEFATRLRINWFKLNNLEVNFNHESWSMINVLILINILKKHQTYLRLAQNQTRLTGGSPVDTRLVTLCKTSILQRNII